MAVKGNMPTLRAGTLNRPTPNRLRSRYLQSGFTLIELTVTLLLISIFVGFALPRIGNLTYSSDLKKSVRQLRAILFAARSLATSDRVPRRVVCDIGQGRIWIERELREEGEEIALVEYEKDTSVLLRTYTLPKGVEIQDVITETGEKESDGQAYLRINTNGIIIGNRIHLIKDEEQYTLVINSLTGKVKIEEGYKEEYKFEPEETI